MLIVQCADCKTVMMSACPDQAIEKTDAMTQVKLTIPFQRCLRDCTRYVNHRVKSQLLFHDVLFTAVAAACQQFNGGYNRIRKFACGKIVYPRFGGFASAQVVNKNGVVVKWQVII